MSETDGTGSTWVAFGPAGAVGSIHQDDDGFSIKLLNDAGFHGEFASLDVAKNALCSALPPGTERPEFHEH